MDASESDGFGDTSFISYYTGVARHCGHPGHRTSGLDQRLRHLWAPPQRLTATATLTLPLGVPEGPGLLV